MSDTVIKLGDLCTVVRGSSPRPKGDPRYYGGNVPRLMVSDVTRDGKFVTPKIDFLTKEGAEKSRPMKKGDFIIAVSGQPGQALILDVDACIHDGFAGLRDLDESKVSKDYLYHFMNFAKEKNSAAAAGAIFKNLTTEQIRELEIPLPYPDDPEKSLKEQKRIAAILDKADGIRRKRQQAIQLADDFLRSVFLDMFGDPVTNPKGWEVSKLKDLSTQISSGSTPKGGSKVYVETGIAFFRSQNVWKNDIRLDDIAFIDEETHKSLKKSSLKHKDILITKTGRINTENSSLGRAALFLGEDDSANVNGHVYLIRLKEKVIHEFIVFILTSHEYREHIRNVCVGGIDKRQLNKDHIEQFPIICPPISKQAEFMKKLNLIHKMQKLAASGKKEAEPLFNTLSQKAFKGEL